MLTSPSKLVPLESYFYILNLGFTGKYIIFLISALKHRFCVLVRNTSFEAVLASTQSLCSRAETTKYQFLSENCHFYIHENGSKLHRHLNVMVNIDIKHCTLYTLLQCFSQNINIYGQKR